MNQVRPITHSELTGASAEAKATKTVADMFVSLRGALACALLTQAWLMVYVVSLNQRTYKKRRLHAVTGKAMREPKRIIIRKMKPNGAVDAHGGSGYGKLTGDEDDDAKGCGIRGASVLRRGRSPGGGAGSALMRLYAQGTPATRTLQFCS